MKSFKIILLILFVGLGLGACQNFLTPTLDNQFPKSRFYTDPAWAQGLLINAYTSLVTTYSADDVATDDAVTNDLTGGTYWPMLRVATGEWSALFDPFNGSTTTTVWSSSYGALININYFLSIVNQVQWSWQDTIRNRLFRQRFTGEAFAFKGYYYLRLLQRYGGIGADGNLLGVPIASGIITSTDNYQLIRPAFQATVDSINSFLESGRKLLPYRYYTIQGATSTADVDWNRVNAAETNQNLIDGRVALALRARLALLAASPAFNGGTNYDPVKCDSAAAISGRMIVNNGGLASYPPTANFWNSDGQITNAEILWRADYTSNSTRESDNYPPVEFGNGRINPTQNLVDAFGMSNGYPITDPLSTYNPKKPYSGRDSRLKLNVLVDSTSLRSVFVRTGSDAANIDGLNKQTLYSTRTGYYLWKLLRTDTNLNPSSPSTTRHFFTHIRWTEMFLIYAEAANEKYGPDGTAVGIPFTPRQVIAAIRKRAGIPAADPYLATITTAAAMRTLIRNERRLEMAFEGYRFWDMRRWALPASTMNANAMGINITGTPAVYTNAPIVVEPRIYILPQMYYGPIPYLDTKKYPGFIQNKGW